MLTLLIDSQPVTLPEGFTFEIHRENPLFFRSGDYTYDIELSLLDPDNRRLYDHIDRIQHTTSISHRSAVLIEGDTVLMRGTEAVLEKTGDTVKIQIVAGNAELNYLTGDETRIRSLNFGTVPTPTTAIAEDVAYKIFPESNYVFPTILKKYDFENADDTHNELINKLSSTLTSRDIAYDSDSELYPMPYFMYILEKFVRLMGYTLTSNPYRDTSKWARLLIIHGYETLEYAKMLPDWTTAKFVQEVEKFLNCIILIDPLTKGCQIIPIPDYYSNNPVTYIPDDAILDDFDIAFDADEDHFFISYENLSYNLPSGAYWKYARLSAEVKELCGNPVYGNTSLITPSEDNANKFIIYYDSAPSHDLYFVCFDRGEDGGVYRYIFQEVDQFRDLIRNPSLEPVSFDIIPSEIHTIRVTDYTSSYAYALIPYPVFYENTEALGFQDAVTNGIKDSASNIMQVAFYGGVLPCYSRQGEIGTTHRSPQCFCNNASINDTLGVFQIRGTDIPGANSMNLRFQSQYGRAAQDFTSPYSIDTTHKRTIRFISDKYIDPVSIFQIQNKRYACRELKYTFKNGQRSNIVEGIFYPIE